MILTAISSQEWDLALKYAFRVYHDIDPALFPLQWHPVRVVHGWVMLRLMMQCSQSDVFDEAGGGFRAVEWQYVLGKLWHEVIEALPKSHGFDSTLAKQVAFFWPRKGDAASPLESDYGGKEKFRTFVEERWARLRKWLESTDRGEVEREIKELEEKREKERERKREKGLEELTGTKKK